MMVALMESQVSEGILSGNKDGWSPGEAIVSSHEGPLTICGLLICAIYRESAMEGEHKWATTNLKDWPQRRVVARQRSVRQMGNFFHSIILSVLKNEER